MSEVNFPVDKSKLDVTQIFLVYVSSVGDISKTAAALDLDPAIVESLSISEGWVEKVKRLTLMSKSGKPGDFERAQNRALNYVQAHLFRLTIEKALKYVRDMAIEEVLEGTASREVVAMRKIEKRISGRFFTDMSKALETVQHLTYAALGDTAVERKISESAGGDGAASAANLHAAVIAALNSPKLAKVESAELLVNEATQSAEKLSEGLGHCSDESVKNSDTV